MRRKMEATRKDPLDNPSSLSPEKIEDELDQLAAQEAFLLWRRQFKRVAPPRSERFARKKLWEMLVLTRQRIALLQALPQRCPRPRDTEPYSMALLEHFGRVDLSGFDPSRGLDPIERRYKKQERGT
jgi:hypothetical protein